MADQNAPEVARSADGYGRARVVAALFVATEGVYFNRSDVDPWDSRRDARTFNGSGPVVAHPPCERWGRYWYGGPSAAVRRVLGDDEGCFESALASVRRCGGVLEHPEASHAFKKYGLSLPPKTGGWIPADGGWTCCVEQGSYGHPARKATWLYYVGLRPPKDLRWGPSQGRRLDEGFHSKAERAAARTRGQLPVKRLSKRECVATPKEFAECLIALAKGARPH